MKRALVVGSGAGGATVAQALQGTFEVTLLEAGGAFRPLSWNLTTLEALKHTGLLVDEREIQVVFPPMRIRKTPEMVLVNGRGLGGTTTLCTGNAVRMDADLQALGINLDAEFEEIHREIPVTTAHQARWHELTRRLYTICEELALNPQPMPKMGEYARCIHCGRCVFGCPLGVKWDSRRYLEMAEERGAWVITNCRVERVVLQSGHATGVWAWRSGARRFFAADLVVLAAGGLATPLILQASGIPCEPHLFVDPVLCVATAWEDAQQCHEVQMPFVAQREGYILSPYFDYLSFFFNRAWHYPARNMLGLMIKLADDNTGSIARRRLDKPLTTEDRRKLQEGAALCTEVFSRLGVPPERLIKGTLNAGHPGGMLPLTASEAKTLHPARLPPNLYVADATLLPRALGNPPILTIIALAKRIGKLCAAYA